MRALELTGLRFGKLLVTKKVTGSTRPVRWECVCDCGGGSTPSTENLRSGNSSSCGCEKNAVLGRSTTTHGMCGHPLYATWRAMRERCLNPKNPSYKNYGARGITVCPKWRDNFAAFVADMGERPPGMTVERIDNAKGYFPDNCKWATRSEQTRNTRKNINVTVGATTMCVTDWRTAIGVSRSAFAERVARRGLEVAIRLYIAERPTLWALTTNISSPYGTTIHIGA